LPDPSEKGAHEALQQQDVTPRERLRCAGSRNLGRQNRRCGRRLKHLVILRSLRGDTVDRLARASDPMAPFDRDSAATARYASGIVAVDLFSYLTMLAASLVLDASVRPRRRFGWRWQGLLSHISCMTVLFGLALAGSGSVPIAFVLAVAGMALITMSSNVKYAMLGEPLLFSDLALFAALFRHPRFYFTAMSMRLRWALAASVPILLLMLARLFVPHAASHLAGVAGAVFGGGILMLLFHGKRSAALAQTPDVAVDLARYGLLTTILLYWLRWRATPDPPACPPLVGNGVATAAATADFVPDIVVIVQCESFADPVELIGRSAESLPGLACARAAAWRWGKLQVSGFGAYTMRSEYGVLFGREEEALGFRRYDPFLTALGEVSYALPMRLRGVGFRCVFVHPHAMGFYGRDRLMPAIGFDRLIGDEAFLPISPERGRYVDDQALGAALGSLIDEAEGRTLLYAVTMENHGPWMKDRTTGSPGGLDAYLRHLGNSDAMLSGLIDRLAAARRSALLVFFGDHRPSIPGVTRPGGARHTPYVVLRFADDGSIVPGSQAPVDLSPAGLHHMILRDIVPNEASQSVGARVTLREA
jgi:hypothetical protein